MKKVMIAVLALFTGVVLGSSIVVQIGSNKIKRYKELDRKNNAILGLYNKWMYLKQEGKTIAGYLKDKGYRTIAIYGMHYMGENLLDELAKSDVEVKYAIDQNADKIYSEINLLMPEDDLPQVDAIIVTAFSFIDEIRDNLQKHVDCPVISLEDIVYDML